MGLSVERWGHGYAVFEGSQRISGSLGPREFAMARMEKIAREREGRVRPCLRCGGTMVSTHAGHRMCGKCRDWCAGQDPQMVV